MFDILRQTISVKSADDGWGSERAKVHETFTYHCSVKAFRKDGVSASTLQTDKYRVSERVGCSNLCSKYETTAADLKLWGNPPRPYLGEIKLGTEREEGQFHFIFDICVFATLGKTHWSQIAPHSSYFGTALSDTQDQYQLDIDRNN